MGYTHYFRTHKDGIPESAWKAICTDTRKLLSSLPAGLKIAFESDEPGKAPEVSKTRIIFNGIGQEGHETFWFERHAKPQECENPDDPTVFYFCKTAHKPYDIVVCGVLIVAAKHAGSYIRVSSDGDLDDWMPAFQWVVEVLGQEYAAGLIASRLTGEFYLGMPEEEAVSA